MGQDKEIRWVGSSYDDLLAFPEEPRRQAGFQLEKSRQVWIRTTGNRLRRSAQVRVKSASRTSTGAYRAMYVAKFVEAIYVLHCFQKKTQATSRHDCEIAEARYRAIVNDRKA